jgi:hypothetical protein
LPYFHAWPQHCPGIASQEGSHVHNYFSCGCIIIASCLNHEDLQIYGAEKLQQALKERPKWKPLLTVWRSIIYIAWHIVGSSLCCAFFSYTALCSVLFVMSGQQSRGCYGWPLCNCVSSATIYHAGSAKAEMDIMCYWSLLHKSSFIYILQVCQGVACFSWWRHLPKGIKIEIHLISWQILSSYCYQVCVL